tara:strand:- start:576 stop:887 length:312 start_codon:yes stop_codon:yes gene_type:complete
MRKSIRNRLNNIEFIKNKAYLSDEWSKREFFLDKSHRGWCIIDNLDSEIISLDEETEYSSTLEILNNRLNKMKRNKVVDFDRRDKFMKRPPQKYPFSDQCGGY